MTDHATDLSPAPDPSALLEELWVVETAGHVRRAQVYRHSAGFEVRIDEDGNVVEQQVFEGRPEADAFAESRRQTLASGGMTDDEAP